MVKYELVFKLEFFETYLADERGYSMIDKIIDVAKELNMRI